MANNPRAIDNLRPPVKGEVRNPNGRPRKTINVINLALEEQGYIEASKQDIISCYLRLINVPIPELEKMIKDSDQPALIRVVGKAILGGKGFDVVEKVLDRIIGKATDNISIKRELTVDDAREYLTRKLTEKREQSGDQ